MIDMSPCTSMINTLFATYYVYGGAKLHFEFVIRKLEYVNEIQ